MNILVLHGANLNLLGERNPELYGKQSLKELCDSVQQHARLFGVECAFFQSNHEGALLDKLHEARKRSDAVLLNAGAYTHTSIALRDAVDAISIPVYEVHLSNIEEREDFRKVSYLKDVCAARFYGKGLDSYKEAIDHLVSLAPIKRGARTIAASSHCSGRLRLPGDKSISHRALMFSVLATGTSVIENLPRGQDVKSTADCLRKLGAQISYENRSCVVEGRGLSALKDPTSVLDCGNSGTTLRLLSGIVAGAGLNATLDGDASLRTRPMRRVLAPLRHTGAIVHASENDLAPIRFEKAALEKGKHVVEKASAQVKSALLLSGLLSQKSVSIKMPGGSRDHTERMLISQGVRISCENESVRIANNQKALAPFGKIHVPGDPSSGAFFAALACARPGASLVLERMSTNPTRLGFFNLLAKMGARITYENRGVHFGEPFADVRVEAGELNACTLLKEDVPKTIDEIPLLALLCTQAKGVSVLRHAKELRVKESDRIAEVARGLKAMGAKFIEHDDGFTIEGEQTLKAAEINPAHDHRIAMGFAILGAICSGVTIENAECVAVSYPNFFEVLETLQAS